MEGEKKSNNSGFSLIELIVAVVILAIIVSAATMSMASVYNARAERATTVSASILKRARQKALAMDSDSVDLYAEFKMESGSYYGTVYYGTQELVREKLGNDQLTFKFCNHNGTGSTATVSDAVSVKVYFKKSTGGIAKIESVSSSTLHDLTAVVDKLEITGSADGGVVILGKSTGRCYIEG